MKKIFALVLAAVMCAGLLAACSSSSGGGSPMPGVSQKEYDEARQAVIDADREWRDANLF